MSSRSWGSGKTPGAGSAPDRGTAGELPRSGRTGSARPLIAAASLLLTLLCVALAVITFRANGLLVLALIFAATFAWSVGAFNKNFWN